MIVLIFIVFVLSISDYVYATSIRTPITLIECDVKDLVLQQNMTCLNEDCSINVTEYWHYYHLNLPGAREEIDITESGIWFFKISYGYRKPQEYYEFLLALAPVCTENLDDIKPIFVQEVENWIHRGWRGGDLVFEPYSEERELELIKNKNFLWDCYYEDFKKVGNWFVVTSKTKDYCYTVSTPGLGSYEMVSFIALFGFLLTHPSLDTLSLLIEYLVIIGLAVGFLIYLFRRKELGLFFKPRKFSVILTVILGIPLFFYESSGFLIMGIGPELFMIFIVGCYILGCFRNYGLFRIRKRKSQSA